MGCFKSRPVVDPPIKVDEFEPGGGIAKTAENVLQYPPSQPTTSAKSRTINPKQHAGHHRGASGPGPPGNLEHPNYTNDVREPAQYAKATYSSQRAPGPVQAGFSTASRRASDKPPPQTMSTASPSNNHVEGFPLNYNRAALPTTESSKPQSMYPIAPAPVEVHSRKDKIQAPTLIQAEGDPLYAVPKPQSSEITSRTPARPISDDSGQRQNLPPPQRKSLHPTRAPSKGAEPERENSSDPITLRDQSLQQARGETRRPHHPKHETNSRGAAARRESRLNDEPEQYQHHPDPQPRFSTSYS
ncbi:uncharacterized protein EI90DRAFT_3065167 [Cantharellus anzutake]|uniref:uncharacterized protein n=1 Tax=Cantharellus anzutake TaxID=1750568 RepID=UPI0019057D70|nr:uncharacterized protein EI90DRAFT_3065167 [Cantharellus anzutake]KAF8328415.1 hypothetical protein EI90DRAFT_3065167 [Cantharellus anzutake]